MEAPNGAGPNARTPTDEPTEPRWPLPFVLLAGIGAAAVLFLIVASLLTIPLFALARFAEPGHGTGREWFRNGLRWAAIGGALVAAAAAGGLVVWLRRGGKLPEAPKPWEIE